jgi:hypothetical protein
LPLPLNWSFSHFCSCCHYYYCYWDYLEWICRCCRNFLVVAADIVVVHTNIPKDATNGTALCAVPSHLITTFAAWSRCDRFGGASRAPTSIFGTYFGVVLPLLLNAVTTVSYRSSCNLGCFHYSECMSNGKSTRKSWYSNYRSCSCC